jgi:hypothetical protein
MGNNAGPIVLIGLLGLLLVLWLRRKQQPVAVQSTGGDGLYGTAKGYVGAALAAAPPAVAYTGKLANTTIKTGASIVNTGIGATGSILSTGFSTAGNVFTSAGNAGASAGKSVIHTLSLGALF